MQPDLSPDHERSGPPKGGWLQIAGIPIRFHFTFLLLIGLVVMAGVDAGESAAGNVFYVAALFASVFLHELAHALAARRAGIRTLEILLLPIGGVARLERQPTGWREFAIAGAGPLANLLLGAALYAVSAWRGLDASLLHRVAAGNAVLGGFNLLPAFPLDGGRMLRAVLARRWDDVRATRFAVRTGALLATGLALYGIVNKDVFPVLLAVVLYFGGVQETAAVQGRTLLRGATVGAAMLTDFRTLEHGQTVRDAAALLLDSSQQDFPVYAGGRVAGLLTRAGLLRALAAEGPDAYVAGVMDRSFVSLAPDQDLEAAAPLLRAAGSCALVFEAENLAGLLTTENLAEYLVLRQLGHAPARPPRRESCNHPTS
jgi:Zn-dependent protease/CBS domain-containing protein